MNWQEVKHLFEWDGSWRDISILNADTILWQKTLDALRRCYSVQYREDGEDKSLPQTVTEMFARRNECSACLTINAGGLHINCHFFTVTQIEFDIDPREIKDEKNFADLRAFMRCIGRKLERDVILTPEGGEKEMLIAYNPQDDSWQSAIERT